MKNGKKLRILKEEFDVLKVGYGESEVIRAQQDQLLKLLKQDIEGTLRNSAALDRERHLESEKAFAAEKKLNAMRLRFQEFVNTIQGEFPETAETYVELTRSDEPLFPK